MIFTSLHIRNFRAIDDRVFTFKPGMNIVAGPNETGKSTILEALLAVLFRNADSSARDIGRWRPWGTMADPYVRIEFIARGETYILEKTFLGAKTARLQCPGLRLDTSNKDVIVEHLSKLIPVFDKDGESLQRSFWIRQGELESTMQAIAEASAVRKSMQQILLGLDGDLDAIKKRLQKEIDDLKKGIDVSRVFKHPGEVRRKYDAWKECERRLKEKEQLFRVSRDDRNELVRLDKEIGELAAAVEREEQVLEQAETWTKAKANQEKARRELEDFLAAVRDYEKLKTSYDDLQKQHRVLLKEKEQLTKDIERAERTRRWKENADKLEANLKLRKEIRALEEQMKEIGNREASLPPVSKQVVNKARALRDKIERARNRLEASQVKISVRAHRALSGSVVRDSEPEKWELMTGEERNLGINESLRMEFPEVLTLSVRSGVSDAKALSRQLREARKSFAELLEQYKAASLDEIVKHFDQRQALEEERKRLEAEMRTLLRDHSLEELEESIRVRQRRDEEEKPESPADLDVDGLQKRCREVELEAVRIEEKIKELERNIHAFEEKWGRTEDRESRQTALAATAAETRAALEALEPVNFSEEEMFRRRKDLVEMRNRLQSLKEEGMRIRGRLEGAYVGQDEVELLREECEERRDEYERMRRELDAYVLVRETIGHAEAHVLERFTEPVEERLEQLLSRLTRDRYHDVKLERNLSIKAMQSGDVAVPSTSDLSTGARGQLALALRLAVADYLSVDEPHTVILDDALVHFDEERRSDALELLSEFSERHQVIYLTCHDYLAEIEGANVIAM